MVAIGPLVSEILMFKSVDGRTDALMDGRRLDWYAHGRTDPRTPDRPGYYKLTLWAFGSVKLKSWWQFSYTKRIQDDLYSF